MHSTSCSITIPIEFEGEPRFGEHDIRITLRYKDTTRDEIFETIETTIFIEDHTLDESEFDYSQLVILGVVAVIGGFAFTKFRARRKVAKQTN